MLLTTSRRKPELGFLSSVSDDGPCSRVCLLEGHPSYDAEGCVLLSLWRPYFEALNLRWTPHPVIVTIRGSGIFYLGPYIPIIPNLQGGAGSPYLNPDLADAARP